MRLIDADALKLAIRDDAEIVGRNYARIKMHINEAPTVEVVRCKDCRNCGEFDHNGIAMCDELVRYVYGDYYCADGERRTDDG